MSLALYRLGRLAVRRRWRVVAAWIAIVVGLALAAPRWGGHTAESIALPGTESQQAFDLLRARFPEQSGEAARVVLAAPQGRRVTDRPFATAITRAVQQLAAQPRVVHVTSPLSPEGAGQVGPGGRIAFLSVLYDGDHNEVGAAAVERLDPVVAGLERAGLRVALGGDVIEFNQESLDGSAELIGLGVAIVVLLIAFGSVVAMGLPILTALVALGAGLMAVTMAARFSDIPDFGPTMASMIGLGVGIDYALFLVTRHREHLDAGFSVEESVARANATSGQAVVFAGATVVIAILGLQAVGIPFVSGLGQASSIVVAVSVLAAVTLLPALLGIAGRGIDRLRLPTRRPADPSRTFAARWARRVVRNPWPYLVGSLSFLVLLTLPVLGIRLGQMDAGALPPSSTVRQAYDLLAEGFGPGFNGPFQIAVDLDGAEPGVLQKIAAAVGADPGVVAVVPPIKNTAGDAAVLAAIPATSPQATETEATIGRLRGDVLPAATAGTGARAYLTGSTAGFIDISHKIQSRLPTFVGAVLALSFLLLMVVFRSLLVPLKAAVMNLLGIGASYGVIVVIFQWGWLKGLLGLEETVPIVSFLPLFMFAILFGLSMDYEVFLMSRIREEFLASGDNLASVEAGIAGTARVITAAAVIMVSVFGSFALMDDVTVKMSGIGLAAAILLDATVIRMILVPATMAVAGRANWWFPAWLDRVLPRLDVEGLPAEPFERSDRHGVSERSKEVEVVSPRLPSGARRARRGTPRPPRADRAPAQGTRSRSR